MEKRYQVILEKVKEQIKSNDVVDMEPTMDSSLVVDPNSNGSTKTVKKANTSNKKVDILPSDSNSAGVVNY